MDSADFPHDDEGALQFSALFGVVVCLLVSQKAIKELIISTVINKFLP